MEYTSETRLKEKGQITIPSKIRESMNLEVGREFLVYTSRGEIILKPKVADPLSKAGMLGRETGVERVKDLTVRYKQGGN
jgi:AbrB family looped-hinge helix DNA binding protein